MERRYDTPPSSNNQKTFPKSNLLVSRKIGEIVKRGSISVLLVLKSLLTRIVAVDRHTLARTVLLSRMFSFPLSLDNPPLDSWRIAMSAFFFIVISWFLASFLHDPLRTIPGPYAARFSRIWMVKHSWYGDMHRTMIMLHKRYGKLVRTGPNEVSVSDLSAIKSIYGAGTKFRKSDWYSGTLPYHVLPAFTDIPTVWQGHRKFDLFAERDERVHASQRRLVSRIYSMDALRGLETYVDDAIGLFMDKMKARVGQDIDMGLFVQLFAFGELGSGL